MIAPLTLQCIVFPLILHICPRLGQSTSGAASLDDVRRSLWAKLQQDLFYDILGSTGKPWRVGDSLADSHRWCSCEYQMEHDDMIVGITCSATVTDNTRLSLRASNK